MTDSLIQTEFLSAHNAELVSYCIQCCVNLAAQPHMSNYKAAYTYIEYSLYAPLLFLWEGAEERNKLFHCLFQWWSTNTSLLRAEEALKCFLLVCSSTHFWCRAPPRVNTVLHHKSGIHGHFKINRRTRMAQC